MQNIVGCTTITTNCGFVWFFLFDNWRKSFKIFADLSVAPKTLLIVIDEYDEARQKKKSLQKWLTQKTKKNKKKRKGEKKKTEKIFLFKIL